MKRAQQRDHPPRGPGDRHNAEIARGRDPEHQRESDAERRRENRDLQALDHAGLEQRQLVGGDIGREHPAEEAPALADAVQEARPGHVEDRTRVDEVNPERDQPQTRRPVRRKCRAARAEAESFAHSSQPSPP